MSVKTHSNLEAEDRFIDKFGQFFEAYGTYPRIAGRIFAYLLLSDPPCQSAEQLVDRLQIAKSSVSSMVRLLLQAEIIERVDRPGVRSRCYQVREADC
jgi:DNA-binding transcriptional regulator GbsR (MarR family)